MDSLERNIDGAIRPVIVKTVCGVGKKQITQTLFLNPQQRVDGILGARVTVVQVDGHHKSQDVVVTGELDLHVWYSYKEGSETGVIRQAVEFDETVSITNLSGIERLGADEEIYVTVSEQPDISERFLHTGKEGQIGLTIGLGIHVDVVGSSKLWIKVYPPGQSADTANADEASDDSNAFAFLSEDDDIPLPESMDR